MAEFQLLGTGACEGTPSPFCQCPLCTFARKNGGKDVRRRFGVLVNGETQIDFGPDAAASWRACGVDETRIRRILFTHSHCDHFMPDDLLWRTGNQPYSPLALLGNEVIRQRLQEAAKQNSGNDDAAALFEWLPSVPFRHVRHGDWDIFPIRATHGENNECTLNYLLTLPDGKKLFILSDTGWWCEESWASVRGENADAAVIEMSYGIHPPYDEEQRAHLGAAAAIRFLEKLKAQHSLKPDAKVVTAHISHCSNTRHSELEAYFKPFGILPGFDGMQVRF